MRTRTVEIAIVGAGTAGLTAYHAACAATRDVVLIEGGPAGTTCARVGCMPSKLLIAAADAAHAVNHSGIFGIDVSAAQVNGSQVLQRVRRERDHFVASVLASMEDIPDHCKLSGMARFKSPHTLRVGDDDEVIADRIILAPGSRPHVPDDLKAAGDRLLLSEDVFELSALPQSVAVFGPGPVGLELGQALLRLGVDVKVFGSDGSLGGIVSEHLRDYAEACFSHAFYLDLRADVRAVYPEGNGVSVKYRHRTDGIITERFDYLLAATGRSPRLEDLALYHSGLTLDDHGVPETDTMTLQCGESHIFLAGDANGNLPVLHEAAEEGRIAGSNAGRYPELAEFERKVPFSVVFTSPQIARIGDLPAFASADTQQVYAMGKASFEEQGRSRVIAENRGMLHVYAERSSGVFAGAEILGPAAEHIGHLLAWAAQQRMTVWEMLRMPYYHPVIEEGLRTALKKLRHELDGKPLPAHRCNESGPGD